MILTLAELVRPERLKWGSRLILCLGLFWVMQPVSAQHKVHRGGAFWPELQVEYVLKSTDYFYFRNQYRHNLDHEFNYLREEAPLKYVERVQFRAGFEHMFNPHWSGGIAEAYAFEATRNVLFNEVFIRHLGTIGSFRFTKRASLEHIVQSNGDNRGRGRFRVDLDRELKVQSSAFRPRVAYELFFDQYYNAILNEARNTRLVDRSRLRLEIMYSINGHLALTPFFIHQTDYIQALGTYDSNGMELKPGGKQNNITPIFGLDIRYAFYKGGAPFPRTIKANK